MRIAWICSCILALQLGAKSQAEWVKHDIRNLGLWGSSTYKSVYDVDLDRMFIFGYHTRRMTIRVNVWDGSRFGEVAIAGLEPGFREFFGVAHSRVAGSTIMYGGVDFGARKHLQETWRWDGSTWNQLSPTQSPPPLSQHDLAECAGGNILLFGGASGFGQPNPDTWLWDGRQWSRLQPRTSPPARGGHAMGWNIATQRVVLFGGISLPNNQMLNDTWEWDGTNWVQHFPTRQPPSRALHDLGFDWSRRTMMLYGGSISAFGGGLEDTWEWDGGNWTQLTPSTWPGPMEVTTLTYMPRRGRSVLFCTRVHSEPQLWELRSGCEVVGSGGKATSPRFFCGSEPRIGSRFELLLPSPVGLALVLGSPGDCSSDPWLLRGGSLCEPIGWLYTNLAATSSWFAVGNPARLSVQIPSDPLLVGTHACFQGVAGENYGCARLSNAISIVVMR